MDDYVRALVTAVSLVCVCMFVMAFATRPPRRSALSLRLDRGQGAVLEVTISGVDKEDVQRAFARVARTLADDAALQPADRPGERRDAAAPVG